MHVISVPYTENRIQKERMSLFVFFVIIAKPEREFKIIIRSYLKFMKWHIVYIVARGIVMPKSYNDILNGNARDSKFCCPIYIAEYFFLKSS